MDPTTEHTKHQQPIVLVIDDDVDVHRLLKARLRHEEIDLVESLGAQEGLDTARELRPAVVLLDLEMPDDDGFRVLRQLKEDPRTRDVLVIILTAASSTQDKVTAFDLGAIDYITKPFNMTELRVRLRSALRTHELVQMLAQRAQIDGLSGLWNRAYFDRRWMEEVASCTRYGSPLSLAMLDLDHFKSVNDSFGHPAGDLVIQGFARLLTREVRLEDVACRYGGEEFAIILPHTGPEAARQLCERVRDSVAGTVWARHPDRTITVSIGVAGSAASTDLTPEAWVEMADDALYLAKQSGRNRVVCWTAPPMVSLARAG